MDSVKLYPFFQNIEKWPHFIKDNFGKYKTKILWSFTKKKIM